jgi:hypothetical protein
MMRTVALDPGGGGGGGGAFSHSDAPRDDREVTSPRGYSDEIVESDPTGDGEILGIDSIPGGDLSIRGSTGGLSVAVTDPQMSLAAGSPFGKKVVTYKVRVVVHDASRSRSTKQKTRRCGAGSGTSSRSPTCCGSRTRGTSCLRGRRRSR